MDYTAQATTTPQILPWRDLYRQEMNCQIIHDSLHVRPGWTVPYFLSVNGSVAGYGATVSAGPCAGIPTIFEFYVQPQFRRHVFELFQLLQQVSGATKINAQSNDPLLTVMVHAFAHDVRSESILFYDGQTTQHALPNADVRQTTPEDEAELKRLDLDTDARWLLTVNGAIAGAGGILFHYNRPYGDIYMKVADGYRRQGLGSYLVQELKRICYAQGNVPAARCNPANIASRQTLQKAGFVPCGHILEGTLTPSP